jgi:tRNA (guanine-N7-)-methyltransferase
MGSERRYADPPRLPTDGAVDLAAWLPGAGPLELEIGPGRGAFLIERAAACPAARLLGLEIRAKWATLVDQRLAALGLGQRARVVCEDARYTLPRLVPSGSVARVFIHFPDPWWKKRHHKRRVIGADLIPEIARLLQPGGELFLQTDVPERAADYQNQVSLVPSLRAAGDVPDSPAIAVNPYGARSNRERRAEHDGLPICRLRYRKAFSYQRSAISSDPDPDFWS